jgi:Mat/Ecp fimbriae major subunit
MRSLTSTLAAIVAMTAFAVPATAAVTTATTAVSVVKPVTLSKIQDMDFGTLTFAGLTANRTIVMSRTAAITCTVEIVCSGVAKTARFNVQGTNKLVVLLSYSGSTMSNGTDTIAFVPNGQANMTLVNSGAPGTDFDVGGSITVTPTTIGGVYTGTMSVTADYQ